MIPSWRRWPARTRLTLWYVLLLVVTLVVLGGLGLWAIGRTLRADADEVLRSDAVAVEAEVDVVKGQVRFDVDDSSDFRPLEAELVGLDVVRLWDRGRRTVYRQELVPGLPTADVATLEAVLAGQSEYRTEHAGDGTSVRLYAEPVRDRGKIIGVIQVGRSEAQLEAFLARLRLLGAGGVLAALALGWAGGHVLAAWALTPVDRITRAAERIGAHLLSERLAPPPTDDELGRLVAAFNGMIGRLDQAFQRERRFTADASHELRTPLASIRTQTEVALDRPRDPERDARVLASIRDESERLGRLVDDLLALARADAGQPLELRPVDLEEIVADASARIAPRARERGLRLTVNVAETGPVRGDATWLTQALVNLLDNAVRHTPPGGQVALSLTAAPGGALLEVADTGEGIAAEHLPHLFQRFYRVDQARARAGGGVGLGLAICDWVASAHGGRLSVDSQLGQGTAVRLWLPSARAPRAAAPLGDSFAGDGLTSEAREAPAPGRSVAAPPRPLANDGE